MVTEYLILGITSQSLGLKLPSERKSSTFSFSKKFCSRITLGAIARISSIVSTFRMRYQSSLEALNTSTSIFKPLSLGWLVAYSVIKPLGFPFGDYYYTLVSGCCQWLFSINLASSQVVSFGRRVVDQKNLGLRLAFCLREW